MKFHPVVSIILGFTVFFVLFILTALSHLNSGIYKFIAVISFLVGGFIAVYLTKEKKIRYGLYVGLLISLYFLSFIISYSISVTDSLISFYLYILLFTCVGGFFGKMVDKKSRKSFKAKFHPVIAIILAIIIVWITSDFFNYMLPSLYSSNFYTVYNLVFVMISFLIGGFISTFLAKEKKIRYVIYFWITLKVISYIDIIILTLLNQPVPNINNNFNYVIIVSLLGTFLTAIIGGYLGIKISQKYFEL